MFNVLPNNLKEKIKSDYKIRFLFVIMVFVLFLQISFLIFLFPSWFLSVYKEQDALLSLKNINTLMSFDRSSPITTIINNTNSKLEVINTVMQYQEIAPLIRTILLSKSASIYLNQFTYTFVDTSTATLTISGLSSSRENLVLFVKNLQESGFFKIVDSPISNFAKDKNINFFITLTI